MATGSYRNIEMDGAQSEAFRNHYLQKTLGSGTLSDEIKDKLEFCCLQGKIYLFMIEVISLCTA